MSKRTRNLNKGNPSGRKRAIPITMHETILSWYVQGMTKADIRRKLKSDHGIKCAASTVGKVIEDIQRERKEAAQAAWTEAASKAATSDIDLLNTLINDLYKDYQEARGEKKHDLKLRHVDRLGKLAKERRDICGLDTSEQETETDEEIKKALLKKLGVE